MDGTNLTSDPPQYSQLCLYLLSQLPHLLKHMVMVKTYCLILHISQVMGTKSGFMPAANPEDMAIKLMIVLLGDGILKSREVVVLGD